MKDVVVITGANGFLGSAVVNHFIQKGKRVVAVVRNMHSCDTNSDKIEYVMCSMEDYDKLPNLIQQRGFDAFIHLAWEGSAGENRKNWDIQSKNISCTIEAVKISGALKCKKFIFAGSIQTYEIEKAKQLNIKLYDSWIYGSAKSIASTLANIYSQKEEIEYSEGIISNIYGEGEISSRLINSSIRKLLNEEDVLCTLGMQNYDFIHISDASSAFYHIAQYGEPYTRYYVGSGNVMPLRDYLTIIERMVNGKAKFMFGRLDFTGVSLEYNEFDCQLLNKHTGFNPKVSFEEGIRRTIQWIKKTE